MVSAIYVLPRRLVVVVLELLDECYSMHGCRKVIGWPVTIATAIREKLVAEILDLRLELQ
jgi:hypothetical protein